MSRSTDKNIYHLTLHEYTKVDNVYITRVPGGWVYEFDETAVFVPFHNEFQEA